MRIASVSFNGYKEIDNAEYKDQVIVKALKAARPYLKQIGCVMPYPRDLVVTITDDECDTFINAYDYNKKNDKSILLASGNEHTLTEYGLDFVEKVFKGLKNNNEKDFKNIAGNFVTSLKSVIWEQHPINFSENIYP